MYNLLHIGGPKDGQWKTYGVLLPLLDYAEWDGEKSVPKKYNLQTVTLGDIYLPVYVWEDAKGPLLLLLKHYHPTQEATE